MLGGTTEASLLARKLAEAGIDAVFSYAGRTEAPVAQPLPTRIGGFGGVAGLLDFLRAEQISHVVDATHPFAAQMSRNAIAACAEAGVPLVAFERPGWIAGPQDRWTHVSDMDEAVVALPDCTVILSRGPFSAAGDLDLLTTHRISHIVAKNAGGSGAEAKLVAARDLGLPVILIDRPALPSRTVLSDLAQVMAWLGHTADLGV